MEEKNYHQNLLAKLLETKGLKEPNARWWQQVYIRVQLVLKWITDHCNTASYRDLHQSRRARTGTIESVELFFFFVGGSVVYYEGKHLITQTMFIKHIKSFAWAEIRVNKMQSLFLIDQKTHCENGPRKGTSKSNKKKLRRL